METIKIISNTTTVLDENPEAANEALFEIFKNEISKKYGKYFIFARNGKSFTAERTPESISKGKEIEEPIEERNEVLQKILGNKRLSEISLKNFIDQHVAKFPQKGRLKTRTHNTILYCSPYHKREGAVLKDFLEQDGRDILKQRNSGEKVYLRVCEIFRELGFNLDQYPVFNLEEPIKKYGKNWRSMEKNRLKSQQ